MERRRRKRRTESDPVSSYPSCREKKRRHKKALCFHDLLLHKQTRRHFNKTFTHDLDAVGVYVSFLLRPDGHEEEETETNPETLTPAALQVQSVLLHGFWL